MKGTLRTRPSIVEQLPLLEMIFSSLPGIIFIIIPMSLFVSAYKAISTIIREKLRVAFTALDEIPLLALPRKGGRKIGGTAVICGGSIAGLLSARVCSDHFESVIIIEPEEWVATEEGLRDCHRLGLLANHSVPKRSRVPQYTSLHAYQTFTPLALRKLFMDFDLEIKKAGARFLPSDMLHWSGCPIAAPSHQYPDGNLPKTMFITRPGYETTLRRLVMKTCPNVKYVTGTVTGLVPQNSSADTIASVRMLSQKGEEIKVISTLVIDCTGPALGGLRWLQDLSFISDFRTAIQTASLSLEDIKTTYNPKMAYTTCEFEVPSRIFTALKALGFPGDYENAGLEYGNFPDPRKENRQLVIMRREYNFLQIACGGWGVYERMTSIGNIKTFVSQVVSDRPIPEWIPSMLDLFEEEQVPATYVHTRCPPSVYVQYHHAKKLPSNFIAIGDSVLQLNPIRGNGCTKACVEAVTLNTMLSRCGQGTGDPIPEDFSRNFFSAQARRTGLLWSTSKYEDYAWKSTIPAKGESLESSGAWSRAYGSEIISLMLKDREVSAVWWHVIHWLAPPTDLFSPRILLKIAWARLRRGFGYRNSDRSS